MKPFEQTIKKILNDTTIQNFLDKTNLKETEQYRLIAHVIHLYSNTNYDNKKSLASLPSDYVLIDIETTGFGREDKVIQIAAVKVINDKIFDTFDSYVSIGDSTLPTQITYLTNINEKILANAPTFTEVSDKLLDFIEDFPIVGHNVKTFDLPFLARNGLDLKDRLAVDTVNLARTTPLNVKNYRLETLTDFYKIETQAHNALNDVLATYEIYNNLKNRDFNKRERQERKPQVLANKKIAYTGQFSNFSRTSLERIITSHGGTITKTVTKNTDYLIVGQQIAKNLKDGIHSSKEIKCLAYIENGISIKMLNEEQFLQLLKKEI
ncbi:exonuclease domain-containing protein [Enterococcus hirae]|uniref:DNA polymerase III polC-type n=2 Tax=Enterococcus hirae TaxID=1354 RepID=I6T3N0_ENTHA|nr:exonuclease domain-containing protein [Enterococcus hirae]AFM69166.1 DNA polymerase III, epsilon subunit [Enterococcus hirae ATCC 9790]EOH68618.1 exonuclease, DNA polymerase III, epsilon subunit [Enterococcus hirae ATCC 9790]EOU05701.1 hypothetical protein I584_01600 [Enterococcus hirae ATCC 9790]MBA5281025.1 3'-5' exoribonuclease [Enterococcus hirae]OJG47899.1 DNA polymerase III subunit epsilon [Enterococcus hirae]